MSSRNNASVPRLLTEIVGSEKGRANIGGGCA